MTGQDRKLEQGLRSVLLFIARDILDLALDFGLGLRLIIYYHYCYCIGTLNIKNSQDL